MNDVNSFEKPLAVAPVTKEVAVKNKVLNATLLPNSFSVIRIKL
jgi:alpha-L-arabinofuranosidase